MAEEHIVYVDGNTLTPSEVVMVAEGSAKVEVSPDAWPGIHASRAVVERIVANDETVYGINTGFGALVNQRISSDDLAQLQVNLIRSHATAIGPLMSVREVRAMMVIRLNSLCKGHSGIHPNCINQLVLYLNSNLHPAVPRIGSLGASGDLAPLSHLALGLIGEGELVTAEGELRATSEVLFEMGILPVELTAKDGLSLINGTSQMSAYAVLSHQRLKHLLPLADVILCTSMEARKCSVRPSYELVHKARPHPGQTLVAERIRAILKDSPIVESHLDCDRVQDAYSFRCAPQVHGAVLESFHRFDDMINIELNSATDNPLIFPTPHEPGAHEVVSQGNFHGEILALTADAVSLAIFELGSISERRIDQMVDPARSQLPAFLAQNSGLESGLMIVQYVAGASLSELRGHASPRSAFSTSTSAGQEDHVSMGATATWNMYQATERLSEVLACEAMVACQALEFEPLSPAPHVSGFYKLIRTIIAPLEGDRSTSDELRKLSHVLLEGSWLARIESEFGRLPSR
ncbi:MAG: histidine ammonia-lyase [Euryarchaeota archaeon]|nr:histidine ammonia-lyase [Euryarchaeota archaeon]|tara:strand:+ start:2026 stop:3585 length:1560 start_codon:yes stop_codon:yes gene_type:complete